ncbi:MAG: dihydroorotate dehydrogenase electron transfer subunit [Deltaproteobacteria bacterium]|nr:dihydroorotate dehydrogenase electron transfer subunit [Deltaproteobacteria bacterium]MBN2670583.1 dihydroorotate dehydrogenase electron transfer subunit [Deltaproteobacteria bacterium]
MTRHFGKPIRIPTPSDFVQNLRGAENRLPTARGAITTSCMKQYLKTTIQSVEEVAPGYSLLSFICDTPLQGTPGQFVMIRGNWGANPVLPRAFSIVQSGSVGQVLVRDVGPGTYLLCNMHVGDELYVLGPLGNGFIPPEGEAAVLVAGGVGVAPLVFLAELLAETGVPITFLYGARTQYDLPLRERIEKVAKLVITTEDGSVGHKGLVTEPLVDMVKDSRTRVYSCGPNPMLEAVGKVAMAAGVECQVALESPMACGMGTCKGCAVVKPDGTFTYVCTDGPVFVAANIYGGEK